MTTRPTFFIVPSPKKPKKRIRAVSKVRAKESAIYRSRKGEHFHDNPFCQHPDGCRKSWLHGDEMDLHHAAGRRGALYTCAKYFRTACRHHHELAKSDPKGSEANGWIIRLSSEEVRKIRMEELLSK